MTPSHHEPALLRPVDAARYLGISRTTLWRLVRDDPDFPRPIRLRRRATAFRRTDLDEWVDRRAAETSASGR